MIDLDYLLFECVLIVEQIGEDKFDVALPHAPRAWGVPYILEAIRNIKPSL